MAVTIGGYTFDLSQYRGTGHFQRLPATDTRPEEVLWPDRSFGCFLDEVAQVIGLLVSAAVTGTSTTSVAIGTGSKSFITQTGKTWVPTMPIRISNTTATNFMEGTVTSYDSSTGALVVNVTATGGSGTFAVWNLTPTILNNSLALTKLAQLPTLTLVGNNTGGTANAITLTTSQVLTMLALTSVTKSDALDTRTAGINLQDNTLTRPTILDYAETGQSVTASATTTIDITSGNVVTLTHGTNITTLNLNNPSPTGSACSLTIIRVKDNSGTSRTIAWPASVKWPGGVAPTLTQTANAVDVFVLFTTDAGTTWRAFTSGLDVK